jgi:hypothetical protein
MTFCKTTISFSKMTSFLILLLLITGCSKHYYQWQSNAYIDSKTGEVCGTVTAEDDGIWAAHSYWPKLEFDTRDRAMRSVEKQCNAKLNPVTMGIK